MANCAVCEPSRSVGWKNLITNVTLSVEIFCLLPLRNFAISSTLTVGPPKQDTVVYKAQLIVPHTNFAIISSPLTVVTSEKGHLCIYNNI